MSTAADFADAKARVLAVLKAAAPRKVSTWDLIHAAKHSRAPARCWDLIQEGYEIEHTNQGRIHYWRFKNDPAPRQRDLFQEGRSL